MRLEAIDFTFFLTPNKTKKPFLKKDLVKLKLKAKRPTRELILIFT